MVSICSGCFLCSGAGLPGENQKNQSRSRSQRSRPSGLWGDRPLCSSGPSVVPPEHLLVSDLCFLPQNVMSGSVGPGGVLVSSGLTAGSAHRCPGVAGPCPLLKGAGWRLRLCEHVWRSAEDLPRWGHFDRVRWRDTN